jgi:hypothetical protein
VVQDARPPRRGERERESIEEPVGEDVDRETPPPTGDEHEHHGITGPRNAESEQPPLGPE